MIALFIYKDTHLDVRLQKHNYKNKGAEEQRKRSGLLQCRGVTGYYVRMCSLS